MPIAVIALHDDRINVPVTCIEIEIIERIVRDGARCDGIVIKERYRVRLQRHAVVRTDAHEIHEHRGQTIRREYERRGMRLAVWIKLQLKRERARRRKREW